MKSKKSEIENDLDKVEDYLKEHGEELSKDQILNLQDKLSKLEDVVLKKKSKAKKIKTITVSSETHSKIKKHCAKNGINIGEWVEGILLKEIELGND
jgi:predicted DNA binding CopG/RHH family protein